MGRSRWSTDRIRRLARSFEDYKKNENKQVKVEEILGAEVARKAIKDAMVRCRFIPPSIPLRRAVQRAAPVVKVPQCQPAAGSLGQRFLRDYMRIPDNLLAFISNCLDVDPAARQPPVIRSRWM